MKCKRWEYFPEWSGRNLFLSSTKYSFLFKDFFSLFKSSLVLHPWGRDFKSYEWRRQFFLILWCCSCKKYFTQTIKSWRTLVTGDELPYRPCSKSTLPVIAETKNVHLHGLRGRHLATRVAPTTDSLAIKAIFAMAGQS